MNRIDTTQILELIAEYDLREITPADITQWHDDIGHLDKAVAEEAVNIHHKTNSYQITPEDILEIAEQIHTRHNIQPKMRRARLGAYQVNAALNYHCEHCGAEPGETCTSKSGQEAFAPCVSRLTGKTAAA